MSGNNAEYSEPFLRTFKLSFTSFALALIMETHGQNSVSCDNFQCALLEPSLI